MRLLLFHPGPARIDCGECQRFVFDLQTGEKKTYAATDAATGERVQLPCIRPVGTPPPCSQCPKKSPAEAHEHELSEKNWSAYSFYLQARAVGLTETERIDPILRRNFAIIAAAVSAWEMSQGAKVQAAEFAKALLH